MKRIITCFIIGTCFMFMNITSEKGGVMQAGFNDANASSIPCWSMGKINPMYEYVNCATCTKSYGRKGEGPIGSCTPDSSVDPVD